MVLIFRSLRSVYLNKGFGDIVEMFIYVDRRNVGLVC